MAKILVADDEQLIRKLINDCLSKEGHEVIEAEDGLQALNIFKSYKDIDMALLDIMMPEIDGWEVCRKIRETSGIPILLVSARSQDFDQIMGFESGADDYVTKPFRLLELLSRVRALLRRRTGSTVYQNYDLFVDISTRSVKKNGENIILTPTEFQILSVLIQNSGIIVTRHNRSKILITACLKRSVKYTEM